MNKPGCSPCDRPAIDPTYFQTFEHFQALKRAVPDPTTLILVDEADRLHMNSLEAIRSIFDDGGIGMVLIGMPGIEKRVARFPQFYSRIGFVHEFRPLDEAQMTNLLKERWLPSGVKLPDGFGPRRDRHADPKEWGKLPADDPPPDPSRANPQGQSG